MASLSKLYTRKEIDKLREELIAKHGDKCAICEKPGSAFKKRLAIDHNHVTGKIRGLLCFRCNKFILGRQTFKTVRAMLAYLMKYDVEA